MRVLCALRVAHSRALAGDIAACERSLASAYERVPGDPATLGAFDGLGGREATLPYLMAEEARCWLLLRPDRAIDAFDSAIRIWPHEHIRDRGTRQARLSLACVAADEPERATAEGMKALGIVRTTKSDMTLHELERLDYRLAAFDLPAVADFREAFAAL